MASRLSKPAQNQGVLKDFWFLTSFRTDFLLRGHTCWRVQLNQPPLWAHSWRGIPQSLLIQWAGRMGGVRWGSEVHPPGLCAGYYKEREGMTGRVSRSVTWETERLLWGYGEMWAQRVDRKEQNIPGKSWVRKTDFSSGLCYVAMRQPGPGPWVPPKGSWEGPQLLPRAEILALLYLHVSLGESCLESASLYSTP